MIQPPDLTVLTEAKSASRRARLLGDTERSILVLRGGDAGDPWDPGSLLLEKVKRLEKKLLPIHLSPQRRKAEAACAMSGRRNLSWKEAERSA